MQSSGPVTIFCSEQKQVCAAVIKIQGNAGGRYLVVLEMYFQSANIESRFHLEQAHNLLVPTRIKGLSTCMLIHESCHHCQSEVAIATLVQFKAPCPTSYSSNHNSLILGEGGRRAQRKEKN
jgi:hypothetical protein